MQQGFCGLCLAPIIDVLWHDSNLYFFFYLWLVSGVCVERDANPSLKPSKIKESMNCSVWHGMQDPWGIKSPVYSEKTNQNKGENYNYGGSMALHPSYRQTCCAYLGEKPSGICPQWLIKLSMVFYRIQMKGCWPQGFFKWLFLKPPGGDYQKLLKKKKN